MKAADDGPIVNLPLFSIDTAIYIENMIRQT